MPYSPIAKKEFICSTEDQANIFDHPKRRAGRGKTNRDSRAMMKASFLHILALAIFLIGGSSAHAENSLLLTDVTIVDVETGIISAGQSVLIRDGSIAAVGTVIATPGEDVIRYDAGGGYLILGLWDSHVHIFSSPTEPDSALIDVGQGGMEHFGRIPNLFHGFSRFSLLRWWYWSSSVPVAWNRCAMPMAV